MVELNLLPHRELARLHQRRRWHGMLGAALGLALLASGALHGLGQQRMRQQEQATAVLEEALTLLGVQAGEVQKLDVALRQGRERVQQWQAWQLAAEQPLRVLELLAREWPSGAGLTRVELEPGTMILQGNAFSREEATALREVLDGRGGSAPPVLLADVREDKDGVVFRLLVPLTPHGRSPQRETAGAAAAEGVAK